MKAKIIIVLASVLSLCTGFAASAQDVDGISLRDNCTKEQLIKKYGQPIKYSSAADYEYCEGLFESIDFDGLFFVLYEYGVAEFFIDSARYCAMTKYVSGGIRVGEPADARKKLEKYFDESKKLDDGLTMHRYLFGPDTFVIFTKEGKIVSMKAFVLY